MLLKPGTQLKSAVCETQVIVIRAPDDDIEVTCGGAPLLTTDATNATASVLDPSQAGGTLLGKRYVDESEQLELLCTKPGSGSLCVGGQRLDVKAAAALPASD